MQGVPRNRSGTAPDPVFINFAYPNCPNPTLDYKVRNVGSQLDFWGVQCIVLVAKIDENGIRSSPGTIPGYPLHPWTLLVVTSAGCAAADVFWGGAFRSAG